MIIFLYVFVCGGSKNFEKKRAKDDVLARLSFVANEQNELHVYMPFIRRKATYWEKKHMRPIGSAAMASSRIWIRHWSATVTLLVACRQALLPVSITADWYVFIREQYIFYLLTATTQYVCKMATATTADRITPLLSNYTSLYPASCDCNLQLPTSMFAAARWAIALMSYATRLHYILSVVRFSRHFTLQTVILMFETTIFCNNLAKVHHRFFYS